MDFNEEGTEIFVWPKISADTPISDIRRIHRCIWHYTAKHGVKPIDTAYIDNCVLCHYAYLKSFKQNNLTADRCKLCPSKLKCYKSNSLYQRWLCAEYNNEERNRLAILIRDTEIKEDE